MTEFPYVPISYNKERINSPAKSTLFIPYSVGSSSSSSPYQTDFGFPE